MRRFRPGLDYTVAHHGGMTAIPRLDATLCFVDEDRLVLEGSDGDGDEGEGEGEGEKC